ncbi:MULTISPECIES: hypothetical protein [Myroides]|uniref:hypothetical protein n=1 Tax=Myroides TaxID=76831 RepID=UPI0013033441|nr:hypothetical protein [Myroides phaeus]
MIRDYLNKLVGIGLKGRGKQIIIGIVLAYNEEWLLIKSNPVDYIIDGYQLIRIDKITTVERDENILFIEEVLKAKLVDFYSKPINLKENIFDTLEDIDRKYGAFGIEFKDVNDCYIGKFMESEDLEYFAFEELADNGEWQEEIEEFNILNVYSIDFDGDYIQSLLLYASKKLSK